MKNTLKDNSLESQKPDLAKEWHPTKNGKEKPCDFTVSSGKKVWWKCTKGDDHEWEARIADRSSGRGCPICSGRKIVNSTCLANLMPDLAKEWHPTKNGDLTPYTVGIGSKKKVWWKCPKGDDHEYSTMIRHRANGVGCSVCDGKTVVLSTCLATTNPEIAKEWHPSKNSNTTPYDVKFGSSKNIWWKCPKGDDHEWLTSPNTRTNQGSACPICSGNIVAHSTSLAVLKPELAKEWHPTKNGKLTPHEVSPGSSKIVWWKCPKGDDHEWQSTIANRNNGSGCGICHGKQVAPSTALSVLKPEIAKEWHPTKNGKLTPNNVSVSSQKKIWWKCPKGDDHEWKVSVAHRSSGKSCPICSGHKVVHSNSLAVLNTELAGEWHPTKNGELTPNDVGAGFKGKVWWKCPKGDDHEWKAVIANRNKGAGCAICAGKKIVLSNCLATTHPLLAKEWHPGKNDKLSPFKVGAGSHKMVWWRCSKCSEHEWKAVIGNRQSGSGCPYCTLTPQSRQELIINFELAKYFEISPQGHKEIVNGKIWTIDIYLSELNLGVEFDGSYWHKSKEGLDRLKTKSLIASGMNVIRIREEPLAKVTENDIISKTPFNAKRVVDKVLKYIMEKYPLDDERTEAINWYLQQEAIQNEDALDDYIQLILSEKSNKDRRTG